MFDAAEFPAGVLNESFHSAALCEVTAKAEKTESSFFSVPSDFSCQNFSLILPDS
jgi:hypothetical protein